MSMKMRDPENINRGTLLSLTACPVSADRLNTLYWRESRSINEISRFLKCNPASIKRWLLAAGIRLRSRSEARVVAYKRFPHLHDLNIQKLNKMRDDGKQGRMSDDKLRKAAARGRSVARKTRTRKSIKVTCGWIRCNNGPNFGQKEFLVYPSRLIGRDLVFCSKECANKHRHFMNRIAGTYE